MPVNRESFRISLLRIYTLGVIPTLLVLVFSGTAFGIRFEGTVFRFGNYSQCGQDRDGDGLSDDWERGHGLDPADPLDAARDIDGDGIDALREFELGTDPWRCDSDGDLIGDANDAHGLKTADADGDGMPDDWERFYFGGTDACTDEDVDGDGVTHAGELCAGSAPTVFTFTSDDGGNRLRILRPVR